LAATGAIAVEDVNGLISDQLEFQKRWQLISMTLYVAATVGTLLCTSAAGVLAAMSYDKAAAILAALSTVLIGVEKSMLFREKWRFHLTIRTKLELLKTEIATKKLDAEAAGKRLGEIQESYALNLPVEAREQ
jgi:hypothetical protein